MRLGATLRSWLRAGLHRSRMEQNMDNELHFHIERYTEDLVRDGISPEEARRRALAEFGAIEGHKEECREAIGLRLLDEVRADLRFACRMLRQSSAFTTVATFSLALGIGANTAIFGLIDTIMVRTLPVKDPEQLVQITAAGSRQSFSHPAFERFRNHNEVFSGLFAAPTMLSATDLVDRSSRGHVQRASVQLVSGDFFAVLGVNAVVGRTFTAEDDKTPGRNPVAVISYGLWERMFARDASVVGKPITIHDNPFTIIGVAPQQFFGVAQGLSPDVWVPLMMQPQVMPSSTEWLTSGSLGWLNLIGRLKPGVGPEKAQAALGVLFQRMLRDQDISTWPLKYQREFLAQKLQLTPCANGVDYLRGEFSRPLVVLMAVVGLVLLIACANVANLLLARAATRHKEIAVRLAIGATRMRLIRQLVTESILLAALGGVLGVLFAYWGSHFLVTLMSQGEPITLDVHPDTRVLGFTAAISLLTGLLFGLAPALRATRLDLNPSLKENSGRVTVGRSRSMMGKGLVVSQVALSMVLLIGAGLFVRTLEGLRHLNPGFNREDVLLFSINPTEKGYQGTRLASLYKQLLEGIGGLPGVRTASVSFLTPIGGGVWDNPIFVEGYTPRTDEDMDAYINSVGPDFFTTLGIPLLLGRDFGPQDTEKSSRVAVINETMARSFFGNSSPLGQRFGWGAGKEREEFEIVGIVGDAKYKDLREKIHRTAYLYCFQMAQAPDEIAFEVRAGSNPSTLVSQIRTEVRSIDKSLSISEVTTLDEQVNQSLLQERLIATLASFFSILALLLASIGLCGVMMYAVVGRTNEIGIRMALGAQQSRVLWMVLRETLLLVAIGVSVGIASAWASMRFVSSMLFGVTPNDPPTIAAVSVLMLAVAVLAAYVPARKASRIDPVVALHYE